MPVFLLRSREKRDDFISRCFSFENCTEKIRLSELDSYLELLEKVEGLKT